MTGTAPQKESRSLRVYARLLELYPTEFLQQHRAEMLQNFSDLEEAATSKTALWLLMGKDLAMSLIPHFFASRLGRYVVAVLAAWMLLFAAGYVLRGSTAGHPALHTFGGFLLGMLSMYVATRLYGPLRNSSYVIGVLVVLISLFTFGYLRYAGTSSHPFLQVFGGVLLGMLSMYIATRLYGTPPNSSPA
jgi:hypothetical protein